MGRISQELAQPVLGGVAFFERRLYLVQHGVESQTELTHLRTVSHGRHPGAEVAGGYPICGGGHALDRSQTASQDQAGPQ